MFKLSVAAFAAFADEACLIQVADELSYFTRQEDFRKEKL
jgi:hypothetical protein